MFSLQERIERSEKQAQLSTVRRWLFYACVFLASAIAFGALCIGISFLK